MTSLMQLLSSSTELRAELLVHGPYPSAPSVHEHEESVEILLWPFVGTGRSRRYRRLALSDVSHFAGWLIRTVAQADAARVPSWIVCAIVKGLWSDAETRRLVSR